MRCGDASDLLGMQTTEPEGMPVLLFWPDVRPDAIRTLYIEPGDQVLAVVRALCAPHDRCQHLVVIVSNPHHDLGNGRSAILLMWLAGLRPFLCPSLSCVLVGRPWLRQCARSLGLVTFPSLGDGFRALRMLVHHGQEPLFDEEASEERRRAPLALERQLVASRSSRDHSSHKGKKGCRSFPHRRELTDYVK